METELQKRNRQIEEIILLSGIDDLMLRTKLESMSFMGVDLVHGIVTTMAVRQTEPSYM